ncbi:MAG: hypothetical protein AAGI23_12275 [Bacteroidota bacterium]
MIIQVDNKEIIPLKEFELSWRWKRTHNPDISSSELEQIMPVSEIESRRLNKVIDYFEYEENLRKSYSQSDWMSANSETDTHVKRFQEELFSRLGDSEEYVIITWDRTTTLQTTKALFVKYWYDFCYPSSDDVTVISDNTRWVLFFRHEQIANFWIKNEV